VFEIILESSMKSVVVYYRYLRTYLSFWFV